MQTIYGKLFGPHKGTVVIPDIVTPVNAVAATATVTYTNATNATNGKKIIIDGKEYKFTATAVAAEGDILIGANADATFTNLSRAINLSGGTPDTDYKVAAAHPTVSSAINTGTDVVTLTARTKGAAGNLIEVRTDETTITLSGSKLGAGAGVDGVDGTVAEKGTFCWDASYFYICTADNTVSGTNWKRLGTLDGSF